MPMVMCILMPLVLLASMQAAQRFELRGAVRDQTGAAISPASVEIRLFGAEEATATLVIKLENDGAGRFSTELPAGTYNVCATARYFQTKCELAKIGNRETEDLILILPVGRIIDYIEVSSEAAVEPITDALQKVPLRRTKIVDCIVVPVPAAVEPITSDLRSVRIPLRDEKVPAQSSPKRKAKTLKKPHRAGSEN